MWEKGLQKTVEPSNINQEILDIKGYIGDKRAQMELVRFLSSNVGLAAKLIVGVDLFPFQEMMIKTMLLRDYSLLILSRGAGKTFTTAMFAAMQAILQPYSRIAIIGPAFRQCLAADTFIYTNEGIKSLKDINIGDITKSIDNNNLIFDKWNNPISRGYKIITKKGYYIKGKIGHRQLVWRPLDGEFKWLNIEDLQVGDYLPIQKDIGLWGDKNIVGKFSHGEKKIKHFVIKEDLDLFYLLGLYYGDGYAQNTKRRKRISITSNDKEIINFCYNYFNSLSNDIMPKISIKSGKCVAVNFCSVALINFMESIGVTFETARFKEIPNSILSVNKEKTAEFLKGLFDSDGSIYIQNRNGINSATIGLATSSKKMATQIHLMLLNYGIVSDLCYEKPRGKMKICGVATYGHESYKIRITGYDNLKVFYDNIGFRLSRKQNKLKKYMENCKNNHETNGIPFISKYLKRKYKHVRQWGLKKSVLLCKNSPLRETITKILQSHHNKPWLDNKDVELLQYLEKHNFYYDSVESIENIELETIDISVDNEECFVSNGIISHNSRFCFQELEKFMAKPEAALLRESLVGQPRHMQDEWKMKFGTSEILACPLGDGSKLRGFRFNCIIIDELLLMSSKVIDEIITPFLSVNVEPRKRQKTWDELTEMVQAGEITIAERQAMMDRLYKNPKMIGLSSASYKFEHLYTVYSNYIKKILSGTDDGEALRSDFSNRLKGSYAVFQVGLDIIPDQLHNESAIEKSRSEMSEAQFKREYGAIFTDDSSGYFSVAAMEKCSIDYGEYPIFEIRGDGSEYILAIDPSFSENEDSDFFAMSVLKCLPDKKFMLVHCYAVAGGKLKDHIRYFKYLTESFNLSLIFMDNAGGVQFLNSCNESKLFKDSHIEYKTISADFNKQDSYVDQIKQAKKEWNKTDKRIVYMQNFSSDWIRSANELLQAYIDNRRVIFAGDATSIDVELKKQMSINIGIDDLIFDNDSEADGITKAKGMSAKDVRSMKQLDLIERQKFLISLTKRQCALIEVKSTDQGRQTFTLPSELKRQSGKNRARRDLYTTLLIGCWANKVYNDLLTTEEQKIERFMPVFLN